MEMLTAIDAPMFDKVNAVGGMIILILTYALGEHWMLFAAFLLCNVLDYITGVMKSKVLHTESSSAGLRGIVKKLGYWFMIMVAFMIAAVLNELGEVIGQDFTMFTPVIGWLSLAGLALNEVRSILENLVELGVPVPAFLTKGLKVASDKLESTGNRLFDGKLNIGKSNEDPFKVEMDTPYAELEKKDSVTLKIKMESDEE